MIIHKTYHTYRVDYPLIIQHGNLIDHPRSYNLDEIYRASIIELKQASLTAKYTYITRHGNDKIPEDILSDFKNKFPEIAQEESPDKILRIPTVWFTCYSESNNDILIIEKFLSEKDIKYFSESHNEYESLLQIPADGNYTVSIYEAINFPKFLHQVTQIGLNLLENADKGKFLTGYNQLEYRRSANDGELDRLESDLRQRLIKESSYYMENIEANDNERQNFWINFQRVHGQFSWPHFLFNICGIYA